jgi:RNA polymerase sigma factor (sigma-70 family)
VEDKAELERLVRLAMSGDRAGLMAVCEAIAGGVLFRVSCRLRNRMDAEDAAQEILIRVCAKLGELNDARAFGGWLNSIIVNEVSRYAARSAKRAEVFNIADYLEAEEDEDTEPLPDEYAIREEDRRTVMEIVKQLPDRQLEAVMLRYYEGMSVTETAEAMGVSQSSVSHYLAAAREKIKNELQRLEKKAGALYGAALLPVGGLLARVLEQEAARMIPPRAWAERAVKGERGTAAEALAPALVLAGRIAAGIAAAAALIAMALWLGGAPPDGGNGSAAPPAAVSEAAGRILFTGGDEQYVNLNPRQAAAQTSSDHGELTALGWEITALAGGAALYGGPGGSPDGALRAMLENGENGEYLLTYSLQDAMGGLYTLSCNFEIRVTP